jgi:hypothetical protein
VAVVVVVVLLLLAAGLCYALLWGTDDGVDGETDPYQTRHFPPRV